MCSSDVLQLGLNRRDMAVYLKMNVTKYDKKAQILHGFWQKKKEEGRRFLQMYMNSEDSKFLIKNSV